VLSPGDYKAQHCSSLFAYHLRTYYYYYYYYYCFQF